MSWIKYLCVIACLGFVPKLEAQQEKMGKDVDSQFERQKMGPNAAHYISSGIQLGLLLPLAMNDSLESAFASSQIALHLKYKRRLSQVWAATLEAQIAREVFLIKTDSTRHLLSPEGPHDVQKLILNKVGIGAGLRLNYGKRGQHLGNYLEFQAMTDYTFDHRLFMQDKVDPGLNGGSSLIKERRKQLDYLEKFQFYGVFRLGFNHFDIGLRYRFSELFKESDYINQGQRLPDLTPYLLYFQYSF